MYGLNLLYKLTLSNVEQRFLDRWIAKHIYFSAMLNRQDDLLNDVFHTTEVKSRRKLLPLFMKIFSWIFAVYGCFIPVAIVAGLMMHNFRMSIYGLEANTIYSVTGAIIAIIFLLKFFVAVGLLRRQDWAVKLGIADAVLGIAVCMAVMLYLIVTVHSFSFKLELAALIPYLVSLLKIRDEWANCTEVKL